MGGRGVFRKGWRRKPHRKTVLGVVPTYTATAALSVGPVTLSSAATFTAPTYSGSAAFTIGPATLSAAATFQAVGPVPVRRRKNKARQWAFKSKSAWWWRHHRKRKLIPAVTVQTFTGVGAFTVGPVTLSGSSTFVGPTYSGSSSLTVGAATLTAVGVGTTPVVPPVPPTFDTPTYGPSSFTRRKHGEKVKEVKRPKIELDDEDEELFLLALAQYYSY